MPLLEVYYQHAIASAIRERECLRHDICQNQPKAAISGQKQIIPPLRNNHVVIGDQEQSCRHWIYQEQSSSNCKSVTTISALEVRINRVAIGGQEQMCRHWRSGRITPTFDTKLFTSLIKIGQQQGNVCRDRDAGQVSIWLKKGSIHALECHNGLFS